MSPAYDVDGVLPSPMQDELSAGTSLLVTGPVAIGKQTLAIRLLAAGHEDDDGILCITTSQNADGLLEEFEAEIPGFDRSRVGIVDSSGSDEQQAIEDIATEHVSSPGDLTGISIGTAKLVDRFSERDVSAVRYGLVSLSTLLQYLVVETVSSSSTSTPIGSRIPTGSGSSRSTAPPTTGRRSRPSRASSTA